MKLAWRVIKLSISDFFDEILWLILFNILLCIAAVTVLALPLVSAGLAWVIADIGEGKVIGWRTFVAGVRRYWKPAYIWGLMNLVVGGLIVANLFFYLSQETSWGTIPLMLFAAVGLWWIGMQFYFFPFLVHQESPSVKTAYRNSLVLMLSQPALSVSLFVLVIILTAISFLTAISYFLVFPLFLFYFTLISVLSNRAVIETLKSQQEEEQEREEAAKKRVVRGR